eukprot:CAMPEP_0184339056 /NCGR_PEP_ID=MMETSP1089-20130417/7736_1 /TAXON_ID=38269 ORGANISM="Gloeochaete wittrockiana, Strain SAG46.84" /NCGR_SAMPLE_ID=MMETSP1089 /ASSEMBLY_ACC=CAM_ASM_000445 /LENGTH=961 /DNA_ID=CAMNT_0026666091 /DNA_START=77 /DNA_END=2959 /DNA_ORIENTATION=+
MPRKFDKDAAPWYHPYKDMTPLEKKIEEIMSYDLPEESKRRLVFNLRSSEQKELILTEVILETPLEKMFEAYDPNRVEKRVVEHFNQKFIQSMTERGYGHLIYSDTDPSLTYFEEIYYLQEGTEERDENGNLRIPMQTQRLHPQSNLELLPHYSPSAFYYSEKRDYDYDKKKAKLDALIAKHENNQDMEEEDVPDRKYEDLELPPDAPPAGFMPNHVHEYEPRVKNPAKAYEETLTPSMLANASDLIVTPTEKKLYNINLRIDEIPELPEWIEIRDKVRLLVKKRHESGHTVLENVDDELNTFLRQWLPSDHTGPDRDLLHEDLDFFKIDDGEYDMTFWEGVRHKPRSKRFFVPKIPSRLTEAPGWYDQNGDRVNLRGELLQDVDEEQDLLEPSDLDKLLGRVPKRMRRRVYEKAYELDPEAPVPRVAEFEPKTYRKVYKIDKNINGINEEIPVDFCDHDHKLKDEMWFFLGKPRDFSDSLKSLFTFGSRPAPPTQAVQPDEPLRKKRAQLEYQIFSQDAENGLGEGEMIDEDGEPITDDDFRGQDLPGFSTPSLNSFARPLEYGGWRYTLHKIVRGTIDFLPNFSTALRETFKRVDLTKPNLPLENDPEPPVTPGDPPRLQNDGLFYSLTIDGPPSEQFIKIHDDYVLNNPKAYDPDSTIRPRRDEWGNVIHDRDRHRNWKWPSVSDSYRENMDDEEYGLGALTSMTLAFPRWYFDVDFTDENEKDDHDPETEEPTYVCGDDDPRPFEKLWKAEVFYNSPWATTRSNEIRLGEPHPLTFFPSDAYGHDFEAYDRDLDNGNDFDEYEPPIEDYVEQDFETIPMGDYLERPINMQERLAAAAEASKKIQRPKFPVIIAEYRIDDPFDMIKFEDLLLNTDILGSHGYFDKSEEDPYFEIGKPPAGSLANNAAIGFAGGALAGAIMGFYMARRYGRTSVAIRTAGVYALTLGCTFGSFLFLGSL